MQSPSFIKLCIKALVFLIENTSLFFYKVLVLSAEWHVLNVSLKSAAGRKMHLGTYIAQPFLRF